MNSMSSLKSAERAPKVENPMLVLSEISPNRFGMSSSRLFLLKLISVIADSELDKVLFKKPRKAMDLEINTLRRKSPSLPRSTSPLSQSKSPETSSRVSKFLENNRELLENSNGKSLKSSTDFRASSLRHTRSFSRTSDQENKEKSIRKKSTSKEKPLNNGKKNVSSSKKKEKTREKSREKQKFEGTENESSAYLTRSMKYDMNFSNSGSVGLKRKKDALISEKYKKLEKIYESLSKE